MKKLIIVVLAVIFVFRLGYSELRFNEWTEGGVINYEVKEPDAAHTFIDSDQAEIIANKSCYGNLECDLIMRYNYKKGIKKYQLNMYFQSYSGVTTVYKGTDMILIFNNGEKMILKPDYDGTFFGSMTYNSITNLYFPLTNAQLQKILKSSGIKSAKIDFYQGPITFTFTQNSLYNFIKEASSMIKEASAKGE